MRINYCTLLTSTILLALAACSQPSLSSNAKPQAQAVVMGDTSQNLLDWPGTYVGTLPCADCEGITTRIRLDSALRYTLSETYLGKSETPKLTEGAFIWSSDGGRITLQGITAGARSTQFQVGENRLIQLDLHGAKIEGALADKYILQKMDEGLTGSPGAN